jgi:hypothetical protein
MEKCCVCALGALGALLPYGQGRGESERAEGAGEGVGEKEMACSAGGVQPRPWQGEWSCSASIGGSARPGDKARRWAASQGVSEATRRDSRLWSRPNATGKRRPTVARWQPRGSAGGAAVRALVRARLDASTAWGETRRRGTWLAGRWPGSARCRASPATWRPGRARARPAPDRVVGRWERCGVARPFPIKFELPTNFSKYKSC